MRKLLSDYRLPLLLICISGLLVGLRYPQEMPGRVITAVWLPVVVASTLLFRRRWMGKRTPFILMVPLLAGYVLLSYAPLLFQYKTLPVDSAAVIAAQPGLWLAFLWLGLALEREAEDKIKAQAKQDPG